MWGVLTEGVVNAILVEVGDISHEQVSADVRRLVESRDPVTLFGSSLPIAPRFRSARDSGCSSVWAPDLSPQEIAGHYYRTSHRDPG